MCGRFQFSAEESEEIRKIIEEVQQNLMAEVRTGEIFPTNLSPVLGWENGKQKPHLYKWGFPKFRGSGVIINARAETILEKPMFRKSMEERRCIVPVSYTHLATHRKLNTYGVKTIGDLAKADVNFLRLVFGKVGEMLWAFANGLDHSPVTNIGAKSLIKSIGNSTTAPRDITVSYTHLDVYKRQGDGDVL